MNNEKKPEIGLLGIMQELYVGKIPKVVENQKNFAENVAEQLEESAIIHFDTPALNRKDIEDKVKKFNEKNLDGIMIVMLTYSPGMRIIKALKENNLPIMRRTYSLFQQ